MLLEYRDLISSFVYVFIRKCTIKGKMSRKEDRTKELKFEVGFGGPKILLHLIN